MSKLTGLVDLVQDAVNKGASSIEEVHKSIAKQPLDILKNITPIKDNAKEFEDTQHNTIGSIYDAIRSVNDGASEIAKDLLGKIKK
jgi:hypothetical protein